MSESWSIYVLIVSTDCMSALYVQDKNTDAKINIKKQ